MKPVIIIAIISVLLIPLPGFAQEVFVEETARGSDNPTIWLLVIGTFLAVGVAYYGNRRTGQQLEKQNEISKNEIHYYAMLEIIKIFNNPDTAKKRDVLYSANRRDVLYCEEDNICDEDGSGIIPPRFTLPEMVASVRGSFDQMGKLVKEGYVREDEFYEMYCDPVIRMGKVLRRHILRERIRRGHGHFMVYFEQIFSGARVYWEREFPGVPEPEPF